MSKISDKKVGDPPGALIHMGKHYSDETTITLLDYSEETFKEIQIGDVADCEPYKDKTTITWINIDGLHQTDIIGTIGKQYGLHSLELEDVLNTTHRPKMEDYDEHIFFTFKMLSYDESVQAVNSEQISIIFGQNYVLTFRERSGDTFNPVRERIKSSKGRIRKRGQDYLVYSLIDTVVDSYFEIIEKIGTQVESLEEAITVNRGEEPHQLIQSLKKEILLFKKSITPLRDAVGTLEKSESELMDPRTPKYLRDVYDHLIHIVDELDTYRDTLKDLMDTFISVVSHKMNQVMKVLTIIATIFIPLTFIAGIYGMNFQFMPELGWKYGYFGVLGIMMVVGIGMMIYFKKNKWL